MFATVIREYGLPAPGRADQTSANLTPASGRQDHTTSPYAATSFVSSPFDRSRAFRQPALPSRFTPDAAASTASHPAFVTTRDRPSYRNGTAGVKPLIWGPREAEVCPSCQSAAIRRARACWPGSLGQSVPRMAFGACLDRELNTVTVLSGNNFQNYPRLRKRHMDRECCGRPSRVKHRRSENIRSKPNKSPNQEVQIRLLSVLGTPTYSVAVGSSLA